MGVGRRFLDLARANLNALLERAGRSELDGASDDDLQAELQRRASERSAQEMERQRRIAVEAAAKSRGKHRPPTAAPKPGDPRTRGAQRRATEAETRAAQTRAHYKTLGLAAGAPFDEVKRAYRALMREHHPDRHAGDAKKQQVASERSASITTAYAALEALLRPPQAR